MRCCSQKQTAICDFPALYYKLVLAYTVPNSDSQIGYYDARGTLVTG